MPDDLVPGDPGRLRASDADRERVAQALQVAMAEGRLTMSELQERLDVVYVSRTVGELEPLTHDLPGPVRLTAPHPTTDRFAAPVGARTSSVAVAVMSGTARKGVWVVPRRFTAVAYWGSVEVRRPKDGDGRELGS